jgi:heme O synthase-like polyprenyltransferase|tara:strand:- start:159 stop:377 length:219 start_codon:yes stop_codon:yes gene_type:complete
MEQTSQKPLQAQRIQTTYALAAEMILFMVSVAMILLILLKAIAFLIATNQIALLKLTVVELDLSQIKSPMLK